MNVKGILFNVKRLRYNVRQLHTSCNLKTNGSYEGPGKTTITILNKNIERRVLIDKCIPIGFKFTDGSFIVGPLAIFPKTILCWNVASGKYINAASLSLFTTITPKLDLLVLGLETNYEYSRIREIKEVLLKEKIPVEILPVEKACAVYNFVSEEGRYVAAGLLPPKVEETYMHKKLKASINALKNEKLLNST